MAKGRKSYSTTNVKKESGGMNPDINVKAVIEENLRRLTAHQERYDPLTGKGSSIDRFEFHIGNGDTLLLPSEMKQDDTVGIILKHSSFIDFCQAVDVQYTEELYEDFVESLMRIRLKYDFEFWCATCVHILDKNSGELTKFTLRKAQRKLLAALEKLRRAGTPIRIVLLKARQWGGSTLVQMYLAWIQIFWKRNWNSAVCADVEDQARNIRGMYNRMAAYHPAQAQSVTLKPYERSPKIKVIVERGNIIGIGSAQKPDSLRSFDFKLLHLSEVGLFKVTEGRTPEDLVQNLRAGVPDVPYSVIVLESTAKGVGNFFHREWLAAKQTGGYTPVFVAWFEIELYTRPVEDYTKLFNQMTDYHWWLFNEKGTTLEAINWYITFQKREQYSDWRMKSEFPSDDIEAFQSTGRRAIPQHYVSYARQSVRKPAHVGELVGRAQKGKDALKDVRFESDSNGRLEVWLKPDPLPMRDRYCVFVDIGGRSKTADYSVIKVFDRYWLMEGGKVEVAAVWRGHLDQDLVAWKAAQIGTYYNNALLAVETNSLKKESMATEGEHFLTILDEIAPDYPNMFTREHPEKINEDVPVLYGFHTNKQTRTMIINTLIAALRDQEYTERHGISCDEMDTFEIKTTGKFEAVEGCKDDCVIVTAGGLWLALKYMNLPALIIKGARKPRNTQMTEATF